MKTLRALCLVAMTVIALAGCSKANQDEAQREIQRQSADLWICAQVRTAATTLDPATVQLLNVTCTHGTVTLQGQVRSATERAQLQTAVKKVKGVRAIVMKVAVNPNAPTGNEVAEDLALDGRVRLALAQQTGMNAFKFDVQVHRGVVTLTGTVPSRAVKTVALDTVRSVDGVKAVVDKVKIQK
jgi:osmotically-inducible protein OsmY